MPKHIHLIGICGSAMASLAGMLQWKGYRITGSDAAAYPPMSDLLHSLGIPIKEPYAEANLFPRPDLVIVGNAISRVNVELECVLDQRIPFRSLAEIIHHEFLPGKDSLVVAGTHGKTTTTSMLAWIYEVASRTQPEVTPSFLIGGIAENFGTSFRVREGRPFIIEGAEYDALKGAVNVLSQPPETAPAVICEIHRHYVDWTAGLRQTPLCKLLIDHGYEIFAIRDY